MLVTSVVSVVSVVSTVELGVEIGSEVGVGVGVISGVVVVVVDDVGVSSGVVVVSVGVCSVVVVGSTDVVDVVDVSDVEDGVDEVVVSEVFVSLLDDACRRAKRTMFMDGLRAARSPSWFTLASTTSTAAGFSSNDLMPKPASGKAAVKEA